MNSVESVQYDAPEQVLQEKARELMQSASNFEEEKRVAEEFQKITIALTIASRLDAGESGHSSEIKARLDQIAVLNAKVPVPLEKLRSYLNERLRTFGLEALAVDEGDPEPINNYSPEWAAWKQRDIRRRREAERDAACKDWNGFVNWPAHLRAAPNALIRAVLFGIGTKRRFLDGAVLESPSNVKMHYTGMELKQYDLNVFLQLLHMQGGASKVIIKGEEFVKVSRDKFLKEIGVTKQSGQNTKNFEKSLERMIACSLSVEIECEKDGERYDLRYAGNLIREFVRVRGGAYLVQMNPRLRRLFEAGYTLIDWEMRQSLQGDLTRWLYDYIRSGGSPIGLEKLQRRVGSTCELKAFRRDVRKSITQLADKGIVASSDGCIDTNDVLRVVSIISTQDLFTKTPAASEVAA